MKLGEHLHRIGNDIVAVHLIDTADGITVIDAGLAGHWADLTAELAAMGRALSDIRGVVLTHGDSDHLGFAERLRRQHGVPVYVHTADAERAKGGDKPKASFGPVKLGALGGFLWYSSRKGGLRTAYLKEVVEVADGDVLDLPGAPRVIGLPGHSPGSIAIHVPVADAVFVGDGLTTRSVLTGKLGPQPAPFTDEPARAGIARPAPGREVDHPRAWRAVRRRHRRGRTAGQNGVTAALWCPWWTRDAGRTLPSCPAPRCAAP